MSQNSFLNFTRARARVRRLIGRNRGGVLFTVVLFLCMGLKVKTAHAASVYSAANGTWSGAGVSAWPQTNRTGTVTASTSLTTVTGVSTLFTTELSTGNIISTQA